ncbi:hypothetical protein Tco_0192906, partial [Tanacetum coccineum]
MPAADSPTHQSPGYIPESDPEEDPEEGDECSICVCVGYVILDNQSIERDRLNGIGFVLNFVKFISFTFGDKEMISDN